MKTIVSIYIILSSVFLSAQIDPEKLTYKSFSVSPIFNLYLDDETGGAVLSADISYALRKHIFSFSFISGSEFTLVGDGDYFQELNVLYGKEAKLGKKFFLDVHAGIGYFYFSPVNPYLKSSYTVGLPLIAKIRLKGKRKFSFGLQFHTNMNSANTIYSAGILLQWNKF